MTAGAAHYPDLARVLGVLAAAGFDADPIDVADACWLAATLPPPDGLAVVATAAPAVTAPPESAAAPRPPAAIPRPPSTSRVAEEALYPAHGSAGDGRPLVVVPDASALPDKLALGRALRPLRRRIASRTHSQVDELATARRTAARRLAWSGAPLVPAFRPARARWLDAVLLVDRSQTMAVWRRHVDEWAVLLQRLGAFRDLRVWYLTGGADGPALAVPGDDPGHWVARDLAELIDPGGRRLVMIASDCIGPVWSTPALARWLARQAATGPLAILQILPPHLWQRTALAQLPAVAVTSSAPGLPTHRLSAMPLDPDDDEPPVDAAAAPAIPVVPLRADALAAWAQLLVGAASGRATGYRFAGPPPVIAASRSAPALDAPAQVRRFLDASTTTARKLAGYLAAVPLTSPVIRIVRQEVVPEAREEHLVEVLFSGLVVQRAPDLWTVAPGDELYDFRPGVREQLLAGLGATAIEGVARAIGGYLERTRGAAYNFFAALDAPEPAHDADAPGRRAFATVSAALLNVVRPQRVVRRDPIAAPARTSAGEHRARELVFPRENGLWILVDGTAADPLPAHHGLLARALGIELARQGFSLFAFGTQGVARELAQAFGTVLRSQGLASGIYRVLYASDPGAVLDTGVAYAERVRFSAEDDVSRAVKVADALLLIGESSLGTAGMALAQPILRPIEGVHDAMQDGVAPPAEWTGEATTAYARDLVAWLARRLGAADSPASENALLNDAARTLDEPDLARYRERLRQRAEYRNTPANPIIGYQLLTDPRRPSHRLVGYGTSQTLSLGTLLVALRLELRTLERVGSTRTLHRALEVVRSAVDAEQVDTAAARGFAVVCRKLRAALRTSPHLERAQECVELLEGLFRAGELMRADLLGAYAARYSAYRRDQPAGPARTAVLDRMVVEITRFRAAPAMPEAGVWFDEASDGERIVGLALALGAPDPAAFSIVETAISASRSAFEQFTALCAADAMRSWLHADQRARLRDVLQIQRGGPPGHITLEDPSRWDLSALLLRDLRAMDEPGGGDEPGSAASSLARDQRPTEPMPAAGPEPPPDPGPSTTHYMPAPRSSSAAVERYRRQVHDELGYLATWPFAQALTVGAVGVIVDGAFQQLTSLRDLGVTFEVARSSMEPIQLGVHLTIVTDASSPGTQLLELDRVGAFFLTTSAGRRDQLLVGDPAVGGSDAGRAGLASQLLALLAGKQWKSSWVVIDEVVAVDAATLVLCHDAHARVEIIPGATGSLRYVPRVDRAPTTSSPGAVTVINVDATAHAAGHGVTPFHTASQLRRLAGPGGLPARQGQAAVTRLPARDPGPA